ncbi:MAG: outer membrane protein [Paraglaciecola sp.]|jgi:outer membrane protein
MLPWRSGELHRPAKGKGKDNTMVKSVAPGVFIRALALVLCSPVYAQAEFEGATGPLKPLWEVGGIGAVFNGPQYPAASSRHSNFLVVPYVVYRGETWRIGDGSVARAVAIDKKNYELDVSLNASFNADSADDAARRGMPDLDYLFEVGPQLKINLSGDTPDTEGRFGLDLQARGVFSTDFSYIEHQGGIFHPRWSYRHRGLLGQGSVLTLGVAPSWGSEALLDYFYQVNPQFAITGRPAYDAKGGYLGTTVSLGLAFEATRTIRLFVGGNLSFYQGSANRASPLLQDDITYAWGIGLSWRAYQSEQQVSGR